MDEWTLTVIWRICISLLAIGLFGYICYCFGKSKAEIFDNTDDEELENALVEAYNEGVDKGYEAALQQIIKQYKKGNNYEED